MKILIIRTFPDKLNLKNYNVQEVGLAKAMTVKGHICDVVLYNGSEKDTVQEYKFFRNGQEYGFKIYWLHGHKFLKNGFMPSVKENIPFYDVIQVHEYDQIMSWQLYTKQKKPTVVYHGPYYDKFAKGYNLKCKIFDLLFLPRRKHDDVVVLTKSNLAKDFMENKGFDDVTTAGVGIDLDNFGEDGGKAFLTAEAKKDKYILYVGKLEERRNVYFLADVFRKVHQKDPEIKLIIIGNGEKEYKENFLDSIKKELEEGSIIYKEKAAQTELAEYYGAASVFLLPTNYEIFGMVLLEAMYFGTPIVSSVNGGSSTLIQNGENGFVIDKFDLDKWAECILDITENSKLAEKMKVNARQTIETGFIWETLADTFLEAYQKAINKYEEKQHG